jgi:hypothetical protein
MCAGGTHAPQLCTCSRHARSIRCCSFALAFPRLSLTLWRIRAHRICPCPARPSPARCALAPHADRPAAHVLLAPATSPLPRSPKERIACARGEEKRKVFTFLLFFFSFHAVDGPASFTVGRIAGCTISLTALMTAWCDMSLTSRFLNRARANERHVMRVESCSTGWPARDA